MFGWKYLQISFKNVGTYAYLWFIYPIGLTSNLDYWPCFLICGYSKESLNVFLVLGSRIETGCTIRSGQKLMEQVEVGRSRYHDIF